MNQLPALPPGFRFGAATASYQIEGAVTEDGRGPSIWDVFSHEPGRTREGETGDVAIDHYHRWEGDLDLLAELGIHDYRFSISWSRILPEGTGAVNEAGLAFYERLVDGLLARGIRPVPTLYHWDLPQTIEERGGWMVRDTAEALADYVSVVAGRLGDRVRDWITLNEMSVQVLYGYALDSHAPGRGLGFGALPAAHHQLLAHGLAVGRLRAAGAERVGVAQQHPLIVPASDAEEDLVAAGTFHAITNRLFSQPILAGSYPEELRPLLPIDDAQLAADLAVISAPLDFYGVNYYEPVRIAAPRPDLDTAGAIEVELPEGMPFAPVPYPSEERTDFGWAIVPEGLTGVLTELRASYPELPPVVITENGASFHDVPEADGAVRDPRRVAFLDAHLRAVADAVAAGVDVQGYYVWSAFDNFEWAAGYAERFGLVYVDYATQARTPKDSFRWYRDVIAASPAGEEQARG
ncbi:GH1 family beta-glucosidase [Protaetiibacter intestinalis]|uniref:Beta-glucosidase n=1 Tax=Protaetiibacter intestinalis TaxID=2419774 RepID=A0A387B1W8_9MICO|nr:GH1 family beta-glucosidase [Protaetiibacter intestinalis]AYF97492.1 beta-glucosidase [Protaetiibacter intestinalis]